MSLHAVPSFPPPSGAIGERIASARGYRRWKQEQLLHAMAAVDPDRTPTRRTLSSWENGHSCPTVLDLVVLAQAVDFTMEWFVTDLDGPHVGPDGPGGQEKAPTIWKSNLVALPTPKRALRAA